jgi:hypothetical protein
MLAPDKEQRDLLSRTSEHDPGSENPVRSDLPCTRPRPTADADFLPSESESSSWCRRCAAPPPALLRGSVPGRWVRPSAVSATFSDCVEAGSGISLVKTREAFQWNQQVPICKPKVAAPHPSYSWVNLHGARRWIFSKFPYSDQGCHTAPNMG